MIIYLLYYLVITPIALYQWYRIYTIKRSDLEDQEINNLKLFINFLLPIIWLGHLVFGSIQSFFWAIPDLSIDDIPAYEEEGGTIYGYIAGLLTSIITILIYNKVYDHNPNKKN